MKKKLLKKRFTLYKFWGHSLKGRVWPMDWSKPIFITKKEERKLNSIIKHFINSRYLSYIFHEDLIMGPLSKYIEETKIQFCLNRKARTKLLIKKVNDNLDRITDSGHG